MVTSLLEIPPDTAPLSCTMGRALQCRGCPSSELEGFWQERSLWEDQDCLQIQQKDELGFIKKLKMSSD